METAKLRLKRGDVVVTTDGKDGKIVDKVERSRILMVVDVAQHPSSLPRIYNFREVERVVRGDRTYDIPNAQPVSL